MVLVTRHEPNKVLEILRREVDPLPSLLRSLLTHNAGYYVGHSAVCGVITDTGFCLRSRRGPAFSLRAKGSLAVAPDGSTEITLMFSKPPIPDVVGVLLLGRYRYDRQTIASFLGARLGAVERDAPQPS